MMNLKRFRVTNFRSVKDSGWVETEQITTLIGTNESGKTNLLLPLWKLNPAREGKIDLLADAPREEYANYVKLEDKQKPKFIEADFELPEELVNQLMTLTGAPAAELAEARVSKSLGGYGTVAFPLANSGVHPAKLIVESVLNEASTSIQAAQATRNVESSKQRLLQTLGEVTSELPSTDAVPMADLKKLLARLETVELTATAKQHSINTTYQNLLNEIKKLIATAARTHPNNIAEASELVWKNLPSFVYYSNYGNLDGNIYLPRVIEDMSRENLTGKEEAKVRTLKVLFSFVDLEPQAILDLGRATADTRYNTPTPEQIELGDKQISERHVLLQSASSKLTTKFRTWWHQGDYRFRFQADGDYFKIWVHDDKRPSEVELEYRSTGLQWFLSFFLTFLVESEDEHEGAILLLDEPGLTLHPIAQYDLAAFFDDLAKTNQLLYTTHSPFMVNQDHLNRVKAVYVGEGGYTIVSDDLRAAEKDKQQRDSVYAVDAALGLSASMTMLNGCQPIICEGASDQIYLSAIKAHLIGRGLIQPKRELAFVPSEGARGITKVAPVMAAKAQMREKILPFVLLDGDSVGLETAKALQNGLYKGSAERITTLDQVVGMPNAEIEDLFPLMLVANALNKQIREADDDFADVLAAGQPLVDQVEQYAKRNNIKLSDDWKVILAGKIKEQILKNPSLITDEPELEDKWVALLQPFCLL